MPYERAILGLLFLYIYDMICVCYQALLSLDIFANVSVAACRHNLCLLILAGGVAEGYKIFANEYGRITFGRISDRY